MQDTTTTIEGKDLKVGNVLEFLNQAHTITHFEDHPTGRCAYSGPSWGMVITDNDEIRVYA